LGRDPICDVILSDDGISRGHAEVWLIAEERVLVRDIGSTNGTYVNGTRIKEVMLEEGGKILLGRRTILKFVLQDQIDEFYQRQMYESSVRDGLTKAYNRKFLDNQLASSTSFSRRHRLPLSFMIFDLDHFKQVNDTHGHVTGDLLLIAITAAVGRMIRAEDVFARYGGEEFAVLAMGIGAAGGRALAERIRQRVAEVRVLSLDGEEEGVGVTVSIGVVTVPPSKVGEPPAIVAQADANLYLAKQQGRDRVVASDLD